MLDRELRQVRAKVIPNVTDACTLQDEILKNVDPFGRSSPMSTRAMTDSSRNFVHKIMNHTQEYVSGEVHTQGIENFWSLLKRICVAPMLPSSRSILTRYLTSSIPLQ